LGDCEFVASKIFISYRRDDSAGHAGRVHDRLEREFGRDLLFMDVDAIPLGADFVKVLSAEVSKCDVLLAVIGPNWLDVKDKDGNRRLDSEDDFVRVEIAAALKRDIPVVPILLEGTNVPKPARLPDDIKDLSRRNGLSVHHASFHSDMDKLVRQLRGPGAPRPAHQEGRIRVDAMITHGAPDGLFKPGAGKSEWFKDHDVGPEMVVVPAGEFTMGSSPSEIAALKKEIGVDWYDSEGPQHLVRINAPFAVGRLAITFGEWDACVADGGCNGYRPSDQGGGRGKRPVSNVSFDDAMAYVEWLSRKTGKTYKLLSEAEREYVTRAGTTTAFWWGDSFSTANYLEPNPWGLYNVHGGNVWEWCEDVWHENYKGAPVDGSAWVHDWWLDGDNSRRVVRGGSRFLDPQGSRAAYRDENSTGFRDIYLGFRVARTLTRGAGATKAAPGER
jgi:formylglycine-generating enzyme required for sulfatase activity